MRAGLVQRLEQMSVYSHRTVSPNPTILSYRLVDLGGVKYRVLSRIRDAGLDFTQRSNFIAHHLAFEPGESVGGASPAEILLFWDGWKDQWEGNPSALQDEKGDVIGSPIRKLFPPCKHWEDLTGDSGWGAFPWNHSGGCCWVHEKLDEYELLHLMGETLRLKSSGKIDALWETSFTTYLGTIVEASKYHWSAWNALDPIPTGKELGKNVIRIESLNGDPIGSKELIEIARGGHPSSALVSRPIQTQSTQKEIKAQAKEEVSKEASQRRESITKAFIPSAKNKQSYLPAFLASAVVAIIAVAFIIHNKISEQTEKASDEALIRCFDSISENLSAHEQRQQNQDYNTKLPAELLQRIEKKDREFISLLEQAVQKLKKNKETAENVSTLVDKYQHKVITDQRRYALKMKINQWRQEQKETKIKEEVSVRIKHLIQANDNDYERNMDELRGIKRIWTDEINEPFPYEYIEEIIEIAKQLPSKSSTSNEEYNKLIERLQRIGEGHDALPFVSKIIELEKARKEKTEKKEEFIGKNKTNPANTVFNEETRKHENLLLDSLFFEEFRKRVFMDYPAATVNYILDDNLGCPDFVKECSVITNVEIRTFNKVPIKTSDIYDEKGFLKSTYNSKSNKGLVFAFNSKNKEHLLIYKVDKPSPIIINPSKRRDEILNDLASIKDYLNKTIIWDSIENKTSDAKRDDELKWSVTSDETGEVVINNLLDLNPEIIKTISEILSKISINEYLNEFKRFNKSITDDKIRILWRSRPSGQITDLVENLDEAAKAYLQEKAEIDNKSKSSNKYSNKDQKEMDKTIKDFIKAIINKSNGWYESAHDNRKDVQPETLNELGEAIDIKVNQYREYLFMPPNKKLTQMTKQEYEDISANKLYQAVISAWTKYQNYIESKQSSNQLELKKENEWLIENVLSNKSKYKLYLGDGELKYFQLIYE